MLGYVTLEDSNGVQETLHGALAPTRALISADGLVGLSPVREVVRPRTGGHGSVNRSRWLSDRLVSLEGEVWGSSQTAAYAELDRVQTALYAALAEPRLLRYRRGFDGVELQQEVRLAGDVKAPLKGGGRFLRYQAQLRADDPRAYAQTETVVDGVPLGDTGGGFVFPAVWPTTFEPGSAGAVVYSDAGAVDTPPVFRIYGQVTNPVIQYEDGAQLVFVGDVAAGHFLEVDVAARTVMLDGVTPRLYMRDFAASTWSDLPPGSGSVRLLADSSSADAYLRLTFRRAYV